MTNEVSNNLIFATWILIALYALVILFFVIRGALKIKNISDYAVGNVNFSPFAVGLSLAASMTSAATFIINPGFIAYYGISAVISFAFVLPVASLFSLVLLTKKFRTHGQSVKAITLAQWMGTKYDSKAYSFFFGILSLLLITFIVLIAVGITKVLANALSVPEINVLIVFVLFVFGYMMFGGANSMVYTNTIQALIMIVVAFILLTSGYDKLSNGLGAFFNDLYKIDPNLTKLYNKNSFLFRDFYEIFISQAVIGIAIVCQPHIITKSLLLKNEKDVNKYLVSGIIIQMLFFLVVITGLYARLTFPDLTINGKTIGLDSVIPTYVVTKFPVYVTLILILGLISAGISTLEGLIQSVSTTITQDLITPITEYFKIGNNFGNILINRVVIIILAIVTIFLSYEQIINPKLSVGIFAQNGVYAYFSAAFVPILFGMFLKNIKKEVVISGSLAAVITHFVMYYGKIRIPFSIATGENPGVAASAAIIVSVTLSIILYLVTKRGYDV